MLKVYISFQVLIILGILQLWMDYNHEELIEPLELKVDP